MKVSDIKKACEAILSQSGDMEVRVALSIRNLAVSFVVTDFTVDDDAMTGEYFAALQVDDPKVAATLLIDSNTPLSKQLELVNEWVEKTKPA